MKTTNTSRTALRIKSVFMLTQQGNQNKINRKKWIYYDTWFYKDTLLYLL